MPNDPAVLGLYQVTYPPELEHREPALVVGGKVFVRAPEKGQTNTHRLRLSEAQAASLVGDGFIVQAATGASPAPPTDKPPASTSDQPPDSSSVNPATDHAGSEGGVQ